MRCVSEFPRRETSTCNILYTTHLQFSRIVFLTSWWLVQHRWYPNQLKSCWWFGGYYIQDLFTLRRVKLNITHMGISISKMFCLIERIGWPDITLTSAKIFRLSKWNPWTHLGPSKSGNQRMWNSSEIVIQQLMVWEHEYMHIYIPELT